MKMYFFLLIENLFVYLQKIEPMKHIKTIFILMAIFSLTHIAYSQQTFIAELPTTRNNETLTEIGSRVEVLSVFPVYIEKDLLFSEDTLFKIELSDDEFNVKKKY